jgi:hypothetical protein
VVIVILEFLVVERKIMPWRIVERPLPILLIGADQHNENSEWNQADFICKNTVSARIAG